MADQGCVTYPDQVRKKLAGKTILVIGSSRGGQRFIWNIFSVAKIKVILVGHGTSNHGAHQVDTFIRYDYSTDKLDIKKHANNIIELLGDQVKYFDGCLTFLEEDAQITALVCEQLELRGVQADAAIAAWSKHKTYEALRYKASNTLFKTEKYSPLSYLIQNKDDIKEAKQISYPAILKPEESAGSWGVVKVKSEGDCLLQYNRIQKRFDKNVGKSMVLMELLDGLSYEVDVVIYDGDLLAGFIADIGLYLPNRFICTCICTPSSLSTELSHQLTTAAHHCCSKLGLLNGVFNTEFKITKNGPKLIEINGRIGSFRRSIVYETTHGVNLWEIAAAIACGIKPCFPDLTTKCFAVGAFLFSRFQGTQFLKEGVDLKLKALVESKDILLVMQSETVKEQCKDEEFLNPFCHLVSLNKTSIKSARQKLIQLFQDLGFAGTEYDIERFTNVWA